MNPIAQTFALALASVAAAAAIGIGLAEHTAAPAVPVTRLERVVIVGHPQTPVAVVVEARRADAAGMTVAQARPVRGVRAL